MQRVAATTFWALLVWTAGSLDAETYRVRAKESRLTVHVGKAGSFKLFGHDHWIDVRSFTGKVQWNEATPEASRFRLEVDASSLVVAEGDVSDEDRAKIQSDIESKALALPEHPKIVFESSRVSVESSSPDEYELKVAGELSLRGVRRELEIPLTLAFDGARLEARGDFELKGKNWGVPQIAALGGTVKTKDELELSLEIVALAE